MRRFIPYSVGYLAIAFFVYVAIVSVVYACSAFLLIRGAVLHYQPMQEFQRNFYFSSLRNIWQGHKECVEFDETLIYKPQVGRCHFTNPEFDTTLTFDGEGRVAPYEAASSRAIAVLGDSHAMGWGVQDSETFAATLQQDTGIRVYNLAVASFGTRRELLRLEKSGLADKVDVVIIQYCDNDLSENLHFKIEGQEKARARFDGIFMPHASSWGNVPSVLQGLGYSIAEPFLALKRKFQPDPDFLPHYEELIRALKEFPSVMGKRVVVFYSNPYGKRFANYREGEDPHYPNIIFANLDLGATDYFSIDGHLTRSGHNKIHNKLKKLIQYPYRRNSL